MGLLLDRKSLPHTAEHEAVRPGLDIDESIITMEDYSAVQAQEMLIVEEPYTPEDSDLDTQVVSIDYKECASTMRQRLETFFPFIDRSQVKFGKQIGRGGQGTVYEAIVRFPSTDKAMKMAVKKFNPKLRSLQGIYPRELWLHDYFFVLKPKAFFFDDDSSLCMVMPRYSGDLRDVIDAQVKVKSGAPFDDSISLVMIVQLAIAMKGLHTNGIYHRDLKAANILVIRYFPYLRDFYYICNIADFENSENVKGTAFWRAPEVLMSLKTNVPLPEHQWRAADVYSFGMTCYEIATGEIPFHDRRFTDYDIVINGGRPELPDHVPELLRDIISSCWHPDPDCRPDFGEILEVLMSKCPEDPFMTRTFMEDLDARRVAVISNSEDPQSDLKELKEIVLRHYAVNHDAIVGRKNYASWGLIYVNALERFVSQYGWDTHLTHPSLPFVDYIERRKLHAVLNCASSRFGNALDMVFEGEERAQVLKEHGPAFVLEKQRMMLLTLALYGVTLQGIEYTQCEDDEHLTLDEKLRMVDNLSAALGDFHGDDGRWALIDDILFEMDPDGTNVKIAMLRDHMNYVARSEAFRKKYDSTLIYMIVMCVMVYMIYTSSFCNYILYQIFGVILSDNYEVFLGYLCPVLQLLIFHQLRLRFPRYRLCFESLHWVFYIFHNYVLIRNYGFKRDFGWEFARYFISHIFRIICLLPFVLHEYLYLMLNRLRVSFLVSDGDFHIRRRTSGSFGAGVNEMFVLPTAKSESFGQKVLHIKED